VQAVQGGTDEPGVTVPVAGDRIRVQQGESANVRIEIARTGGFEDAVQVDASDLPVEVTAEPLTIEAGSTSAMWMICAGTGAAQGGPNEATVQASAAGDPSISSSTLVDVYVAGPPGSFDVSFSFDDGAPLVLALAQDDTTPDPSPYYVRALNSDGSINTSFGASGDARPVAESAQRLVLRPAGVVTHGYTDMRAHDDDGVADGSFSAPLSPPTNFNVATADGQDRIVFGGGNEGGPFTIARLLPDGALDASFGMGGMLTAPIPIGHMSTVVQDLAIVTGRHGTGIHAEADPAHQQKAGGLHVVHDQLVVRHVDRVQRGAIRR
jgi:hypothetical protein